MQEFDKMKCLKNIYYLARQKDIKIGDLERQAGVSIGYMSRLNKEGNTANPGLEFLISAANTLNVSLDSLCFSDYSTVSSMEAYVLSFLDWLSLRTYMFQLRWQKKPDDEFYDCLLSDLAIDKAEIGEDMYEACRGDFKKQYTICGSWFLLETPDKTHLYLLRFSKPDNVEGDPAKDRYLLFLIENHKQIRLAASEVALFHQRLVNLYTGADKTYMHPMMEPGIKEAIEAFINECSEPDDPLKKLGF